MMSYFTRPIRNFFVQSNCKRTTQTWIQLQFTSRSRCDREAQCSGDGDEDNTLPLAGSRSTHKSHQFPSARLLSLLGLIKRVAKVWDQQFPGWRSSIAAFSVLATIMLIINISALVWAVTHLDDGYYATIAIGFYKDMSNLSRWIHLGISILNTALLAGSNYCMQCLTSPTREEVDRAHESGTCLDIGILSWRNVLACSRKRVCILVVLVISSVALHATYDSSIVNTNAFQVYDVAFVTPEFLSGGNWTLEGKISEVHDQRFENRIARLQSLAKDGQILNQSLWDSHSRTEFLIEEPLRADGGSILLVASTSIPSWARTTGSLIQYELVEPSNWGGVEALQYPLWLAPQWFSLKVPGRCRVQIHLWFLLAVTVLNVTKLTCFLWVLKDQRTPLLITGDAVASFLAVPCNQTIHMCLLAQNEIIKTMRRKCDDDPIESEETVRRYRGRRMWYGESVDLRRWILHISYCLILVLTSAFLYKAIIKYQDKYLGPPGNPIVSFGAREWIPPLRPPFVGTWSFQWEAGLGKLRFNANGTLSPPWCSRYSSQEDREICRHVGKDYFHMILATIPQIVVSLAYISLNYHLTAMVQLRDWAKLATKRQPLRVSNPQPNSDQTSTYWLSLPYAYSIPSIVSAAILGWLLSQTLFFYRHRAYDNDGERFVYHKTQGVYRPFYGETQIFQGLGYSVLGLLCSLAFGILVFLTSLAVGLFKCPPGPPVGASNSLVIAAACHPPANDRYAATKLIRWGVVANGNDGKRRDSPQHCTISSRRVEEPVIGNWYA